MPILTPPPVPHPVVRFARAIETAALAILDAAPATKAGGDLGVVTREKVAAQPTNEPRDYSGKADVPAIWVRAVNTGTSAGVTAGSRSLYYSLTVGVVTEDALVTTSRQANDDIQGVAVYTLLESIRTRPNTWLDGISDVYLTVEEEDTSMETPEQREGMVGRFESVATIPITVLWSNWEVW